MKRPDFHVEVDELILSFVISGSEKRENYYINQKRFLAWAENPTVQGALVVHPLVVTRSSVTTFLFENCDKRKA